MNPFAWILITFPVYLLVRGRLFQYFDLAARGKLNEGAQQ